MPALHCPRALLAASAGSLAVATLAAGDAHAACALAPGAATVARTPAALVSVEARPARVWRGCAESTGVTLELERGRSADGARTASRFKLAGAQVAYLVREADRYERVAWLAIVDLRTDERWSTSRVTVRRGGYGITEHALTAEGDLAWIQVIGDPRGRRQWRLYLRRAGHVSLRYRSAAPLTGLTLTAERLRFRERGRLRTRSLA